jgi:ABC-2 type transport system permease protein
MAELVRLTMKVQLTKARLGGMGAFALLGVILAVVSRSGNEDVLPLVLAFGLGLYVPLCALILATAALGDLVDDKTLVYIWLKPIARWRIAAASLLATIAVALPLGVIPVAAMAAIGGTSKEAAGAAVGAVIAVVGYSALFVALGLRIRRALVWGLAYLVIWEGTVARVARGAGRLSVQLYARSALAHVADTTAPPNGVGLGVAVVVAVLVLLGAAAVTTRWLKTLEVA